MPYAVHVHSSAGRESRAARPGRRARCTSSARCSTRPSRTSSSSSAPITSRRSRSPASRRSAIVAGRPRIAKFAGREHDLPIHREMAEDILNKLVVEHNFDIAYSEDAELGHAFSIPFEYVIGKRNIPVIPFFTNVYVPPLPTPQALRGARPGARARSSRAGRSASRSSPAAACRTSRGRRSICIPEFDFDRWLRLAVRSRATPTRCSNMTPDAARRSRQHRDAELGGDVRRDRRAAGRARSTTSRRGITASA